MSKKVKKLRRGSTVAVLSPSWDGPAFFPLVYDLAIKNLKDRFGFKIKEFPSTRGRLDHKKKAEDLVSAFNDDSIDAIIASIGGDDSIHLLKYLDREEISPKFFMGYSDTTVLLNYFYSRGFVTFHGPSVMAGFAEPGALSEELVSHLNSFLFKNWETYQYEPFSFWTEEKMDWDDIGSFDKKRSYEENTGWQKLGGSKGQIVEGRLWGGCLEALEFIKDTKYLPSSSDFWNDKILMLEISDEKISANSFKYILRNYGLQNVFQKAKAILFGRFANMNKSEIDSFKKVIVDVVYGEFESDIPVILNMDFGHTYPQQIFPIGGKARIELAEKISISVESPFTL